MNEPEDIQQSEIMTPTVMESQSRAEYDVAISTAKRYPRVLSVFMQRAEGMATLTPAIAEAMEYAKPVGTGKVLGPSTRLAEIVASCYGNIRTQARVVSEDAKQITAQGICHDLETNVAQSTEVTISIVTRQGKRYGDDQVATMRAAACSKARRNAIFLIVPRALIEPIIVKARLVAAGNAKTLPERRKELLDWFDKKGVKRPTIYAWLQIRADDDIDLDKMGDLIAARNSANHEGIGLADIFRTDGEKGGRHQKDETPAATTAPKPTPEPITEASVIALAKKLPDAECGKIMEANQVHTIGGASPEKLAALHADFTKVIAATGRP